MSTYDEVIATAAAVVEQIAPGYNPFTGHLKGDSSSGKSTFDLEVAPGIRGTLADLLTGAVLKEVLPGDNGAVCFVFDTKRTIGVARTCNPDPNVAYTVKKVHGCLQLVGAKALISESPTTVVTCVLTPEKVGGGGMVYALASAHPGYPGGPITLPWAEGAVIKGTDCVGFRVVIG